MEEKLTGRISWVEMGGRRFKSPRVILDPPGNDERLFAGLIGSGLLWDFVVVFNYPRLKIALLDR